jgi:arabinan endo-1,5-alpha-L-arabinosidase
VSALATPGRTLGAHDPTVVRGDDGRDVPAGVHLRVSADLVRWDFVGTALPGVPAAARDHSGAVGLWAPDVIRWPVGEDARRWRMYYSASSFGSRTSAIGLATAPSPAGPWTDEGLVVSTVQGIDAHNAIDAAIVFDRHGDPWLAYGSFFDGIRTLRLGTESGLPLTDGDTGVLLARRSPAVDGAIEGAYIEYRPERDDYVLYVSYDSLFDSYSIRVGIAAEVTGPYLDAAGRPLLDAPAGEEARSGTKILGGLRFSGAVGWSAPGHNSIFFDGAARFLVHHVRRADDARQHEAQIRRVHTTRGGWPIVSPHPFAGYEAERLDAPEGVEGTWHVVRLDPERTDVIDSEILRVSGSLRTAADPVTGEIVVHAANDVALDAVAFGATDERTGRPVLAFGGIDGDGVVWIGSKEASS